ncbi:hypothetical protein KIN20_027668 [Parelaphostrongylus tenuis]|uniref:Uncharacterized protein n=1 Tax=Parelaphostrongylus tenuis TaxID=148309 RepID=A0AAD5QZU5_PARTN|nr:hypothetical protein KIN20_027668 [Parelaphostrongylus tenuis]
MDRVMFILSLKSLLYNMKTIPLREQRSSLPENSPVISKMLSKSLLEESTPFWG